MAAIRKLILPIKILFCLSVLEKTHKQMNMHWATPEVEIEGLLLSKNKNCATLPEQIQTKPQRTIIELKFTQATETFSFTPSLNLKEEKWKIGLSNLAV